MPGETKPKIMEVEVFRPGTHRAMDGKDYTFSADDVAAMASAYDASGAPAPAVVGHPKHDDPAFGWAEGFRVNEDGVLVAQIGEIEPAFADAVKAGRYRKISLKLFPPGAPGNPKPEGYYPRHVGFLGAAAPAVSGLKPVEFTTDASDADLIEIEFSAQDAIRDIAGALRRVREFIIDKFSREDADEVLPDYMIRWIETTAEEEEPGFTAPVIPTNSLEDPEDATMSKEDEDKLATREADIAKRERALTHGEHVAFADALIDKGRLPPAQKGRAVALLDALAADDEAEELAFSVGEEEKKASPLRAMRDFLSDLPEIVPLGEADLGAAPAIGGPAFASPDGLDVDPAQLETHRKALAFMAEHPGVEYLAAVSKVQEA